MSLIPFCIIQHRIFGEKEVIEILIEQTNWRLLNTNGIIALKSC